MAPKTDGKTGTKSNEISLNSHNNTTTINIGQLNDQLGNDQDLRAGKKTVGDIQNANEGKKSVAKEKRAGKQMKLEPAKNIIERA